MDEDYDGEEFVLRSRAMPCCGAQHKLHELKYTWPQGFGRSELSAVNSGIGELSRRDREQLGKILGCAVQVIYRRM